MSGSYPSDRQSEAQSSLLAPVLVSSILSVCLSVFMISECRAQEEEFEMGGTPAGGTPAIDDSRCETPNVLLLLDRSGSMLNDMKWEQATSAVNDVFVPYFDTLRFGMLTFPTEGACGVIENPLAISMGEAADADLASIFDEALPIDIALTPLAESINAGKRALDRVQTPNRRSFMILLTDGIETCVPEEISDSAPIDAVRAAADAGYTTYVIGFGSLVRRSTLRNMAEAGGSDRERLVSDQANLTATFNEIIESATTEVCDLLDNDCDGRVDEGIDCAAPCYPELQECPCTGSFECNSGERCVEGSCESNPCQVVCDTNYICRNEQCIPIEGLPAGQDGPPPAGSQTEPSLAGVAPPASNSGDDTGGTIISSPNTMTSSETAAGCQMRDHSSVTFLLIYLGLLSVVSAPRRARRTH